MKQSVTLTTAAEAPNSDIGAVLVEAVKQALLGSSVKHALLRPATACAFLGISRTGLHRLSENDPTFPRKIVISRRCVGYRAESLAAWLAAKESGF